MTFDQSKNCTICQALIDFHGSVQRNSSFTWKYIGVKPDLYDPIEDKVKAYLHGEDVVFDEV